MIPTATSPRRPILCRETHARQLGLAYVRAVEGGDRDRIALRAEGFLSALIVIAQSDGDDDPALALEIHEHVEARVRAAQGRPPIAYTSEIVATPARRRSFVRLLAEALSQAWCKGA